jgi:hypothetical protein
VDAVGELGDVLPAPRPHVRIWPSVPLVPQNVDGPQIAQTTNAKGQPQSPAALNHLRTTLRAALNLAVREGLIYENPARHIEIHGYRRPHAQVWTEGRIEHWELTGEHPPVAVWTAEQLASFLADAVEDSLFVLVARRAARAAPRRALRPAVGGRRPRPRAVGRGTPGHHRRLGGRRR